MAQPAAQLKTMQEVITLGVFAVFSTFYLGEAIKWNHIVALRRRLRPHLGTTPAFDLQLRDHHDRECY